MPNSVAYLMLMAWPLVSLILFRRLPLERAILWCLIAGYLLLPPLAEFDLPLVPDMDKFAIPSVMAFLLCLLLLRRPVPLLPRHPAARVLTLFFVFGVIPTVLTNGEPILFRRIANSDPIVFLTDQLPGLRWRDLGSVIINQMIVLIPFLLARRYLSTPGAQRELLLALMIGGLAYTVPSLIEIRLSPQINIWVYGFFQHDFSQMMRQGGFRPIVFLPHALWLAFFMLSALLAATALARAEASGQRLRLMLAAVYLFAVLVLCKSLASLAYALAFTPVVALAPLRWQLRAALLLALIAAVYPILRNTGLVPTEALVAQADAISAERAQSLNYRFENETRLLARAAEKPWFGWGGWGRSLVRHAETGQILSVPDGRWIIVFGTFGWLGYIAEMGLLAAPLVLLAQAARHAPQGSVSPFAAPIALILAATMVDMLLNATLIPITWMCAGSVLGYAERLLYPGLFSRKPALFGGAQALLPDTAVPERRSLL
ncbi:membrane protein [Leisingera methylohalidivorans]|uniref:Membrane protein n=1 Tax=Leisingera methylohalidivorans DSM 14336 TaxID=999552 RepID=V9VUI3_9RHOB|nr:membrane protein [Leisingera methylohalidivorans]AHD01683.1 membrane protein [Leisingera methylohalidivorans DSM 14336]